MNMSCFRSTLGILGAAAILTLIHAGCEDEPSSGNLERYFEDNPYSSAPRTAVPSDMSIVPTEATVNVDEQKVAFRVRGGDAPYDWGVGNSLRGDIVQDRARSDSAVYSVRQVGPNTVVATDNLGRSVAATIKPAADAQALEIVPDTVTLTASETNGLPASLHGTIINFNVVGGAPPYGPWQVSAPKLGTINPNTGVYTVKGTWGTGDNTISITDDTGKKDTAKVTTQLSSPGP